METIVSKPNILYNIRLVVFITFWAVVIYMSISYSITNYNSSPHQVLCIVLVSLGLISLGVYKIWIGVVNKMIVTRENITIYFLITNRRLTIKHTDVKAIYDANGNNQRVKLRYRVEELELNDETSIRFLNIQFTNYNELKAKLWEYRLLAYAELREKETQ